MTESSDAELLARFRVGEEAALETLFGRYEMAVFQFLVGILRNHHQAEDALQETFVRALERLEGVDPDHLRGWLFTVAYHQALLLKRKQKSKMAPVASLSNGVNGQATDVLDGLPGPAQTVEQRDEASRLRDLLEQLPQQQREVIRQRVYEGKRFREIAEQLDCPLNTALARMHEGLKKLRVLWEQSHA